MLGTPIQEQFGSDSGRLVLPYGFSEPMVNDAEMVMKLMAKLLCRSMTKNVDLIELRAPRAWRTMMATRKLVMR